METDSTGTAATKESRGNNSWVFPALLVIVLGGLLFWSRGQQTIPTDSSTAPVQWTPSARPEGEVALLEIDFGNGAKRVFDALPWHPEMTVAEVMMAAHDFKPGINYVQVGEGASGFLTELEGLKNEGANGRNWRYEVAGNPGTKSFCLQTVGAGEVVRWWFAGEEEGL